MTGDVADRDELFRRFADGRSPAIRNQLVESFLPLAEYFAGRYKQRGAEQEDLRQVAKMALVKAVDRFDVTVGVQFSTFAGRTIDGELKRYFRDKTWAVRVPRSVQEASLRVRRVADDLTADLGRSPSVAELAEAADLDEDLVLEALDAQSSYTASSLDRSTTGADGSQALVDRLGVPDRNIEQTEVRLAVQSMLSTLEDRERRILELRFFDELSQSEIAEEVGVSQMHVSRLLRRSLEELRAQLRPAAT